MCVRSQSAALIRRLPPVFRRQVRGDRLSLFRPARGASFVIEAWLIVQMGLRESRILFDWLERETGKAPLVIDSADLLKAPEDVMRASTRLRRR